VSRDVVARYPSVLHALLDHCESKTAAVTVQRTPDQAVRLGLGDILDTARRSAAILADRGIRRGDRVLLAMPTAPAAITAFFAIQIAGAIPVPFALPASSRRMDDIQSAVCGYVQPAAVIAPTAHVAQLSTLAARVLDIDRLHTAATHPLNAGLPLQLPDAGNCAVIQCTSGSTANPKGVMISHANLAANCEQIIEFACWKTHDTSVGWLPLYHDMGLIGALLAPIFAGAHAVLIPPKLFLRSPIEWLRAVHEHRGAISATPNFGLSYATHRIADRELCGIDLSSWRMIFCGAEPINWHTTRRFITRFAPAGLAPNSIVPCYGLAEAGLIVSAAPPGQPVRRDIVSRSSIAQSGHVVDVSPDVADALEVVEVGPAVPGTEIRIVNAAGDLVPENRLGSVQFRGPSRTPGYYGLHRETAATLHDGGWWTTGDLGYLRNASLRITGRERDTIIIRGANYFPVDFERAAESVPHVRAGSVAAVAHREPESDTDQLWLIVETGPEQSDHAEIVRAITRAVSERTSVAVSRVLVVPKGSIPKTTSGKIRRNQAYQRLAAQRPFEPGG
jgi:fatty-acyl-CoA synthase